LTGRVRERLRGKKKKFHLEVIRSGAGKIRATAVLVAGGSNLRFTKEWVGFKERGGKTTNQRKEVRGRRGGISANDRGNGVEVPFNRTIAS